MADKKADKAPDKAEVVTTAEDAQEAGFFGTKVDPEPNESYTVAGVTKAAKKN